MRLSKSPLVSVWLLALALASLRQHPCGRRRRRRHGCRGPGRAHRRCVAHPRHRRGRDRDRLRAGRGRARRRRRHHEPVPAEALKEKKSVGYMRALSSEGVISVDATLILASERSGPPEVVKTLKTTSVPYVEIPDQHSAAGIAAKVRLIARAVGTEAEGERVVAQVEADFKLLAERTARIKKPLRAAVRACRAERPRRGRRPEHQRRCDPAARRRRERGGGGQRLSSASRRGARRAGAGGDRHDAPQLRQRRPRHRRSCSRSRACVDTGRPPTSASSPWTGCISWASARARPPPRASSWASSIPTLPAATRAATR